MADPSGAGRDILRYEAERVARLPVTVEAAALTVATRLFPTLVTARYAVWPFGPKVTKPITAAVAFGTEWWLARAAGQPNPVLLAANPC